VPEQRKEPTGSAIRIAIDESIAKNGPRMSKVMIPVSVTERPASLRTCNAIAAIDCAIAQFASKVERFSLAEVHAAMHKGGAFQASSPNDFGPALYGPALFYCPRSTV
jgi:hypothetical protein